MPGMGQILYEKGLDQGISQGIRQGISQGIIKGRDEEVQERIGIMLRKGRTPEEIADFCDYDLDLIREVEQNMMAMAYAHYTLDNSVSGST